MALKCPNKACGKQSMVRVNSEPPVFECVECGDTFSPVRVSRDQIERMNQAVAVNERHLESHFQNHLDSKLWVPKNYH